MPNLSVACFIIPSLISHTLPLENFLLILLVCLYSLIQRIRNGHELLFSLFTVFFIGTHQPISNWHNVITITRLCPRCFWNLRSPLIQFQSPKTPSHRISMELLGLYQKDPILLILLCRIVGYRRHLPILQTLSIGRLILPINCAAMVLPCDTRSSDNPSIALSGSAINSSLIAACTVTKGCVCAQ